MSKKETARINGKFKGNQGIFSLERCGIESENNEGLKQILGEGVFPECLQAWILLPH